MPRFLMPRHQPPPRGERQYTAQEVAEGQAEAALVEDLDRVQNGPRRPRASRGGR